MALNRPGQQPSLSFNSSEHGQQIQNSGLQYHGVSHVLPFQMTAPIPSYNIDISDTLARCDTLTRQSSESDAAQFGSLPPQIGYMHLAPPPRKRSRPEEASLDYTSFQMLEAQAAQAAQGSIGFTRPTPQSNHAQLQQVDAYPQQPETQYFFEKSASPESQRHSMRQQHQQQQQHTEHQRLTNQQRWQQIQQHHHHHRLPNQPLSTLTTRYTDPDESSSSTHDTGPPSVVGQDGMPSPAAKPKGPKLKFTAEEDTLLVQLKEVKNLTWKQIADFFPGRSSGTLQVRYCTKLRAKTTGWTDEMVQRLLTAIQDYDNDRWRVISSKVGNGFSAAACRDKASLLQEEGDELEADRT